MGYIYKITNKINNKSYIGQTITPIKIRMYKHYSNAKTATTGIDFAIKKYGKENFIVEQLCECANENLNDQERYYIHYYDTYNNGYNLTIGGQDITTRLNLNEQELINSYLSGKNIKELSIIYNCSEKTISNILHVNNIEIRHNNNIQNILGQGKQFKTGDNVKAVYIPELEQTFPSLKDCAQWLIDNNYSKANSMEMARKSISRVLRGDRKTYCKLHFQYADQILHISR